MLIAMMMAMVNNKAASFLTSSTTTTTTTTSFGSSRIIIRRQQPHQQSKSLLRRGLLFQQPFQQHQQRSHRRAFCNHQTSITTTRLQPRGTPSCRQLFPSSSLSSHFRRQKQQHHDSRLFVHSAATTNNKNDAISAKLDYNEIKRLTDEAFELYESNMEQSSTTIEQLQSSIADLEREQSEPEFWDESNSQRSSEVLKQLSEKTQLLSRLEQWTTWHGDCTAAIEMLDAAAEDDGDTDTSTLSSDERSMLLEELELNAKRLSEDCQQYELELLLTDGPSNKYSDAPARIVITAGAGGTEANDWVSMLWRMYERYANSREDFSCHTIDKQPGDVTGYKTVELLITGPNAYGWFRGEKGAHRLVRLSPYNANNKRQTTFAGVDVAPDFDIASTQQQDISIPDNELEITTMRSGGKGGQNVNKVESAVRIKHIPSGIQVKCTQERSQSMNKDIAMRRLKSQLLAIANEQRVSEIREIRGDIVQASWGEQIRNYVMHPYKMVKDTRTGWEISDVKSFLDGDETAFNDCIGTYLKWYYNKQQQE